VQITATKSQLSGRIKAIPSKSFAHRILLCAMLSHGKILIEGINFSSDDIVATKECVRSLGCDFVGEELVSPNRLKSEAVVNCNESGSLLRFIVPILSALNGRYIVTGSKKLLSRPMDDLVCCLRKNGASIAYHEDKIDISGQLKSGDFILRGDVSSQFITGLLLALPLLDGDSKIILTTSLASTAYVDITIAVMEQFGVKIIRDKNGFTVPGRQRFVAPYDGIKVEGDWSNAAFWLCGAAISGSATVSGLNLHSVQGDRKIIEYLSLMGASVVVQDDSVAVSSSSLKSIDVDVDETIDLVPVLAVLCSYAKGKSRLRRVSRLRFKESDRITAVLSLINSLGGRAEEEGDDIVVYGTELNGGTVCGYNDHRIVMSALVAALGCDDSVTINGAQAMNKSYPGFTEEYNKIGGKAYVNVDGQ